MDKYEEKLKSFMQENNIHGEHLVFSQSCHTVEEAARAANANPNDFVKSICMIDAKNNLIVAIVKGEDWASTSKVEKTLDIEKIRITTRDEILQKTGYPCGGTPAFGYDAKFLIDERVMEREIIYAGGGSENSLVKISTKELQKANNGVIARVRK